MTNARAQGTEAARAGRPAGTIVVLAASAGGITVLSRILTALPRDLPAAVAIVQHRSSAVPNVLAAVLGRRSSLPVLQVDTPGTPIRAGTVYLAPADRHLMVLPSLRFGLVDGHRIRHVRSSANPLFESAAEVYGPRVVAVVLTGGDSDATDGVQAVAAHGGVVIVQDPATAQVRAMPESAHSHAVSLVLGIDEIAPAIERLVREGSGVAPSLAGSRAAPDAPDPAAR